VAIAMVAVGSVVIADLERAHGAEPAAVLAAHVFANAAPLTAFGALALTGVWQRRVPARHKRLLLLATVVLAPAALGRLFARFDVPDLALPVYAALAFANAAYDAVVLRRVHAVALGGAVALIALDVATTWWLSAVGG
jgi:hypothetical protein